MNKIKSGKKMILDLTGLRFGKLIVIERLNKEALWRVRCDCGAYKRFEHSSLVRGKRRACGTNVCRAKYTEQEVAFTNYKHHLKKGARTRGLKYQISDKKLKELINGPCYYCGSPPEERVVRLREKEFVWRINGVDRVDNKVGYKFHNVVSCCRLCNRIKLDYLVRDFLRHAEAIHLKQMKLSA